MSDKMFDPTDKIWKAPKRDYPYGNESVAEVIYKAMLKDLQHVCQINDDTGETYTQERMLKASVSFANALKKQGIKEGDIVIVLMHNYHYLLPTWFGCILAGVILCPFHYTDNAVKDDLTNLLKKINPKIMITTYLDLVEIFQSVFDELKLECPIYTYENIIEGCHDLKPLLEDHFTSFEDFTPAGISDPIKDTVVLTLSSATTGKAKLINITHKQVLMQFSNEYENMTIVTTTQPGWHSEFLCMLVSLKHHGCRVIRVHSTIDQILLMLEKYKAMGTFMKPKDIFEILKTETIKKVDLSELIIVISSGGHLSMKFAEQFQNYLPNGIIVSLYGTSEMGGGSAEPSNLDPDTPNLVGKIKRNFEFYVLDEAGNRLGPNQVGELCMSSLAPFAGYYKDPEKTKASTTHDGFFYTGDMGHIDEDGNIFLLERKKFLISYRDKILNQWDVEKIILENVEDINAVCVVDVESDKHGLMPYIAIVPKQGTVLVESDIIKTVMQHHPFEFETRVLFFDKLPMTISGKYKKFLIKDMILKKLSEQ